MQATNKLDKYVVAVQTEDSKVVGYLPLGKSGKFFKTKFYYLKQVKAMSAWLWLPESV